MNKQNNMITVLVDIDFSYHLPIVIIESSLRTRDPPIKHCERTITDGATRKILETISDEDKADY